MSWPLVCLGDLCSFENGDRGVNYPSKGSFVEAGIPFINAGNLLNQSINKKSLNFITQKQFDLLSNGKVREGDVLYCLRGSIGKFALVKNITKGAIASSLIIIRPGDDLSLSYFSYFLRSILCEREIKKYENGAAQPNLSAKDLKQFQIPLPPLETQKQIAAVLEKADQLRKDSQQMEQELNSLAQSVFIDMFGDPVTNPNGLKKLGLKRVSKKLHDGPFGSNLKTSHYTESGVQVIRLKNIGSGEFKEADKAYVSEEHAETLHKFKCYPGEIVIATLGDPNLRACIIPKSVPVSINKADCVHCVVDDAVVNSEYLVEYLNLPSVLHTIQNKLHGQTRTRISSGQLATIDILIPSLIAQQEYLDVLMIRTQLRDDLKKQAQEYDGLFNALMQKAFKGELDLDKSAA